MFRKILFIIVASLFFFGVSKASFAMMCGEHGGSKHLAQAHSEHGHGATEATKHEAGLSKEAVNVGNKICPVSGEEVGQGGMEPVTYEYEGKIYNFCCEMCVEGFKKDPQKYIGKVEEELQLGSKKEESQESSAATDMGMPTDTHEGHHH